MNKQVIIGSALALGIILLPVAAQASRGSNDSTNTSSLHDQAEVNSVSNDDLSHEDNDDHKVTVNPTQADVVLSSTSSTNASAVIESTKTLQEAVTAAQKQFPNKTVKEVEQESEDGKQIWEIKFTDGSKVEVDAVTGLVISFKDASLNVDNSGHGNGHDNDEDTDHSGSSHN